MLKLWYIHMLEYLNELIRNELITASRISMSKSHSIILREKVSYKRIYIVW